MGFMDSLKKGLSRSREAISEIFYMGGEVDEDFWEDLEDTLVMGDMGGEVASRVTDDLREQAARENITRAPQLREALAKRLAAEFVPAKGDPFTDLPSCVLFVGINGAGKTTTVGKLAGKAHGDGVPCLIGGADTFRAAAIEQLQVWGKRASVDVVTRERGADPASVCYDVIDEALCASSPRWSTSRASAAPPCPSRSSSSSTPPLARTASTRPRSSTRRSTSTASS